MGESPLKIPLMADDEAQTGEIRQQNAAKKMNCRVFAFEKPAAVPKNLRMVN